MASLIAIIFLLFTHTFKKYSKFFYWVTNIDILKYESSELACNFLDTLSSNFLSPQIILTIRISFPSTLTDNILCNLTCTTKSIFDNLTSSISDHLPQFLILSELFSNVPPSKYNMYILGWTKFSEYLPSKNYDPFPLTPLSKVEIDTIISSLNSNKSAGLHSIPLKILKLTKNQITQHLTDTFNLSFKT